MSPVYKYPRDWEPVNDNTCRLQVPGGWIVRSFKQTLVGDRSVSNAEALLYVPDADRVWELD